MPVYNAAETLENAIRSIVGQTFKEWELVVVDDGSRDNSPDIMRRLAEEDDRIRICRNPINRGIGASLNLGWQTTRCELVARMDADDVSFPNRLEEQVAFMMKNPEVSVAGTGIQVVDKAGSVQGIAFRPARHEDLVRRMYKETPFFHPTVIMRRRFLSEMNGYDEELRGKAEDLDLWLRGYRRYRYGNLSSVLLRYYMPERATRGEFLERATVLMRSARREGLLVARSWYLARFIVAGMLAAAGLRKPSLCRDSGSIA